MRRSLIIAAVAVAFFAGIGFTLIVALVKTGKSHTEHDQPAAATSAPPSERKVLYWFDPMVPRERFDKPGKSPFMDMMLVPKYADETAESGDAGGVRIETRLVQNLGVRTAKAVLDRLDRRLRASGAVAFDQRAVAVVQARVAAIVERLHVRAALDPVRAGDSLMTLIAPEWTAAQEEYLGLLVASSPDLDALRAAARQRLLLLGMSEAQILGIERRQHSDIRIVVSAPRAGVVTELGVREGAAVSPGMPLVTINGLATVWVNAAVPEAEAAIISTGARAIATVAAFPGRRFEGRVEALLPEVDAMTRTLRARIVLDNSDHELAPGMFANLELQPVAAGPRCVLVPSEAVIVTGARQVVIVAVGAGRFRAQQVRVGAEAEGRSEILEGLEEGERVVLSGQFLIDSEASLSGALARLDETGGEDGGAGETSP